MAERIERSSCLDEDVVYPDGSEQCMDVYCFKCVDGKWETHPWIADVLDLSRIL